MELKDTVQLMGSGDYRDRFIAEYRQTKIRYERLKKYCNRIEAGEIDPSIEIPDHDCPLWLLQEQQKAMGTYLHFLELRAVIERIDLEEAPEGCLSQS